MSGGWEKASHMQDQLNRKIDKEKERKKETALEETAPNPRIRVYRRNNNSNNA